MKEVQFKKKLRRLLEKKERIVDNLFKNYNSKKTHEKTRKYQL